MTIMRQADRVEIPKEVRDGIRSQFNDLAMRKKSKYWINESGEELIIIKKGFKGFFTMIEPLRIRFSPFTRHFYIVGGIGEDVYEECGDMLHALTYPFEIELIK